MRCVWNCFTPFSCTLVSKQCTPSSLHTTSLALHFHSATALHHHSLIHCQLYSVLVSAHSPVLTRVYYVTIMISINITELLPPPHPVVKVLRESQPEWSCHPSPVLTSSHYSLLCHYHYQHLITPLLPPTPLSPGIASSSIEGFALRQVCILDHILVRSSSLTCVYKKFHQSNATFYHNEFSLPFWSLLLRLAASFDEQVSSLLWD